CYCNSSWYPFLPFIFYKAGNKVPAQCSTYHPERINEEDMPPCIVHRRMLVYHVQYREESTEYYQHGCKHSILSYHAFYQRDKKDKTCKYNKRIRDEQPLEFIIPWHYIVQLINPFKQYAQHRFAVGHPLQRFQWMPNRILQAPRPHAD